MSADPLPAVAQPPAQPANAGWGFAFRFDARDILLHGAVALEYTLEPRLLRLARVIVSPVPRYLNEVDLSRPWAEVVYLIVKKSLEPKQCSGELTAALANELRRTCAEPAWMDAVQQWGMDGQEEALRAEALRLLKTVIDARFDISVRFFPALSDELMNKGAQAHAESTGEIQRTVTVTPQSSPVNGTQAGSLTPGDELFVKITDDSANGLAVRTALQAADDDGTLRAVAAAFVGVRAIDDRGNLAITVQLTDDTLGVMEVYRTVKIKTVRGLQQGAALPDAEESTESDEFNEERSLAPWLLVVLGALLLTAAAWVVRSLAG